MGDFFVNFIDSYYYYYGMYCFLICFLFFVFVVVISNIYRYIGYWAILDTLPYLCLVCTLLFILCFKFELTLKLGYNFLEIYIIYLMWYTNIYYINSLHIVACFSEKHKIDGLLYFGHSQTWYWVILFIMDNFVLEYLGEMACGYFLSHLGMGLGWITYLVFDCLFYFGSCYVVAKLMDEDAQIFFVTLNRVAFFCFIYFLFFYPMIPY